MTYWPWINVWLSLQMFEYFLLFLMLLSSSFILLWSDSMQGGYFHFLIFVNTCLCPKIFIYFATLGFELRASHFLGRCSYSLSHSTSPCPKVWSILDNIPWGAENNVYCAAAGSILCRCLSGSFGLWCHLILKFLCCFFCLDDLSVGDRGVLKSPTIIVLGSIYAF
jgi:hypothetical protein